MSRAPGVVAKFASRPTAVSIAPRTVPQYRGLGALSREWTDARVHGRTLRARAKISKTFKNCGELGTNPGRLALSLVSLALQQLALLVLAHLLASLFDHAAH